MLTALAWTIPFVPGVHATTSSTSESFTGEVIAPHARSFVHPGWPKFHGSRCPFFMPQSAIVLTAHSPAAFRLGEPVTRGPYTSVRKCSVRITCDRFIPSSRIRELTSESIRSSAANGRTAAALNNMATAPVLNFMKWLPRANTPPRGESLPQRIPKVGRITAAFPPEGGVSFRLKAEATGSQLDAEPRRTPQNPVEPRRTLEYG